MGASAKGRAALWLHGLFEASLVAKAVLALAEGLSGFGLLLTSNVHLVGFVDWLTRHELAQDPTDRMATWVRHAIEGVSSGTQHFYALYLLSHGVLKLAMLAGLAAKVSWAYPVAMAVMAGFVLYQMREWSLNGSPLLLALSALDAAMIALIWREFRLLGRQNRS